MSSIIEHPESDCIFVADWSDLDPFDASYCHTLEPSQMRYGQKIAVGLGWSEVLPSLDFETYSEAGYLFELQDNPGSHKNPVTGRSYWVPPYKVVNAGGKGKSGRGLPLVGTPAYAEHPSTRILSLSYNLKDGRGIRRWTPGRPPPRDLFEWVTSGGLYEAWNVAFEWFVWNLCAVRTLGWPALPLSGARCAMAKARRYSLPGSLGAACDVLGVEGKDKRGADLLNLLSVPHTPTKKALWHRNTPQTHPQEFQGLYGYNDQDTVAEDNASARIPDLTPEELEIWQTDQRINARGVQVDVEALHNALDVFKQCATRYNAELNNLTLGAVENVNQNKRFIEWVREQGVFTKSLDEDHRDDLLKRPDLPANVRRALEIANLIGSANVKKLQRLAHQVNTDGRLRNQYIYCGADRTGRYSAGGVQLQNLTAKGVNTLNRCESCDLHFGDAKACPRCGSWLFHGVKEWHVGAVCDAIEDLKHRDAGWIEHVWGAPVDVLCGCLRGMFTAAPGHKLICCDFSAIEAVVAACLARCQWRIDLFSDPTRCVYTESASAITGRPMAEYWAHYHANGNKWCHPDRKKIGKVAELASGYGGWIGAWLAFGAEGTDDEIKQSILAWRAASPEIVYMWGGQYIHVGPGNYDYAWKLHGLEGCAIEAILNPGQTFSYIDIAYFVQDDILHCRLPSGRFLYYHRPRLTTTTHKLTREPCYQITFEGYNSNSQKGPVGWGRWDTYGGRLFENVVQAVARDLQCLAQVRLEQRDYPIVMHTHDENTAEVPLSGPHSVDNMAAIMTERPAWASWWPIRAAGWEHFRYQKD